MEQTCWVPSQHSTTPGANPNCWGDGMSVTWVGGGRDAKPVSWLELPEKVAETEDISSRAGQGTS